MSEESQRLLDQSSVSSSDVKFAPDNRHIQNYELSPLQETPEQYKSRWRSIRVTYFTMFFSSVGFSIVISSVWPFLNKADNHATESFLGWVIAAYSLGQLVASPLFGLWANKRPFKEPLVFSMLLSLAGNVLYGYAEAFTNEVRYVILLARLLIGLGAGNIAVCRSYLGSATSVEERTGAMAVMSAFQSVGYVVGPAFQTAFVPIGEKGVHWNAIKLHLSIYTMPAFLSVVLALINILLAVFVFKEHNINSSHQDKSYGSINKSKGAAMSESFTGMISFDRIAALSSIMIFFVILFIFSLFEMIMTPLTMDEYGWTRQQAVLYTGLLLAGTSIIAMFMFIGVGIISKRVDERIILCTGLLIILMGVFLYLPWGNNFPPLLGVNVTGEANLTTTGCPTQYDWCHTVPQLYLPQFLTAAIIVGFGYPISFVVTYAIFSKILGPKPQGTMMGWITAAGSLARTLGPVVVSVVYTNFGPRVTFGSACGLVVLTLIGIAFVYKRLVPYANYFNKLTRLSS